MKTALFKTITYRILGSASTFTIAYFTTGQFDTSVYIGITELIWKPILYFMHEIIWSKLRLK